MTCREIVERGTAYEPCGAPAVLVRLRCPAGRPDVTEAYCDAHGGEDRARATAERDWLYVAPASVGDSVAVLDAGSLGLRTIEAYIVISRNGDGVWLAWRGLGGALDPVSSGWLRRRHGVTTRVTERPDEIGWRPHYGFAARDVAEDRARVEWAAGVAARVEQITAARGGTLTWGIPVEPMPEPIVIDLAPGENAWDVASARPRITRLGAHTWLRGLRPSGEIA